jgi:hypothetical protein
MRAVHLLPLCAVLLLASPGRTVRGDDLPPAVKETLDAYEKEAIEVQERMAAEWTKAAEKTADQLKPLQDKFSREAKLEEAVAVRDQIRQLQAGAATRPADLPPEAREVMDAFDKDAAEMHKKAEARRKKAADKASAQLKLIQDKFCKEGKLDEAVAVRDTRLRIQSGVVKVLPDPGNFDAPAGDVGKVYYFDVVGTRDGGSTWGSDVYTTQSHLGVSAVHAGVLRAGQRGIVKVTVMPGQDAYMSTTRNGVTSAAWDAWGVSFKVERAIGVTAARPKE